ncbi:GDSL-type esterase/lipase family protein [Propionibacteriaceae bacterium Y2011]
MQQCDPGTRPELWQGAVCWTRVGDLWQPWRLLPEEEPFAYAPTLYSHARSAAGVRFVADVEADRVEVDLEGRDQDPKPVDIVVDGELLLRQEVSGRTSVAADLPSGVHRLEVWLPHVGEVRLASLSVHHDTSIEPVPARTRWVTYGSSITHCGASPGPSETWPALVARALDWDLTCLGFGGQCHLDPAAERTIAALEVDVVSMCLGINIYGSSSFNERSLPGRLAGFVRSARAAHPEVPLVLISPILSPDREEAVNQAGLTLGEIRGMVTTVAADLQGAGDTGLELINGLDVFGPGDVAMLPDGLHPDGPGYRVMAERLTPRLMAAASR